MVFLTADGQSAEVKGHLYLWTSNEVSPGVRLFKFPKLNVDALQKTQAFVLPITAALIFAVKMVKAAAVPAFEVSVAAETLATSRNLLCFFPLSQEQYQRIRRLRLFIDA